MCQGNETEPKVFDRVELLRRFGGDADLLEDILKIYLGDIPKQIEVLKKAVADNDVELVHRKGHSIKGASDNVAAARMKNIALLIEKAGREADLGMVPELTARLETEFQQFCEYFKRH